jgi:lipopolysaccharide export system protein LptA
MMKSPRFRKAIAVHLAASLLASGLAFAVHAQSSATGVPNAMQGFTQNRDQPIQIESARLDVQDKKKQATFSGNVKVVQGDTTMTSKTLDVFYEGDQGTAKTPAKTPAKNAPMQQASPGPTGSSSIKRLEAKGDVVVTQKDQVVTGDSAIFDTKTNLITMTGGVVLTQCQNVLKGDRLTVDMTTGVSRVDSETKVIALLPQGGNDCAKGGAAPPSLLPGSSKPK